MARDSHNNAGRPSSKGHPTPPSGRAPRPASRPVGNPARSRTAGGTAPRSSPPGKRPPAARPVGAAQRREREQQISQLQGQRRRRRKKNYTLYYIMLAVLLTVTGVTLSLTVFFNIETIEVNGSALYSEQQVLDALDVKTGDNLLRLNLTRLGTDARQRLVAVEAVALKRRFPNTLVVEVEDAVVDRQIVSGEKSYQISEGGRIVAIEGENQPNVPVALGPDLNLLQLGDQLDSLPDKLAAKEGASEEEQEAAAQRQEEQKKLLSSMDIVFKEIESSGLWDISIVDVRDSVDLKIYYQNRFELSLGSLSELPDKLAMFQSILNNGSLGLEESGTLDITDPDRCIVSQAAPQLPVSTGLAGWNWLGPHLDDFDVFFGFASADAPSEPEGDEPEDTNPEGDASPEGDPSASGQTEPVSSEPASEPEPESSPESSSEPSNPTSGGYMLPQMPQVGGSASSEAATHELSSDPEGDADASKAPDDSSQSQPEESSLESSEGASQGVVLPQMPQVPVS